MRGGKTKVGRKCSFFFLLDLGSDLLCLFYDNFLNFNFTILDVNEWFSIFLTYSCVSACGRKERTEIFAYLGFNVQSLGHSIVSYTCKCLNQTVTRKGTSIP